MPSGEKSTPLGDLVETLREIRESLEQIDRTLRPVVEISDQIRSSESLNEFRRQMDILGRRFRTDELQRSIALITSTFALDLVPLSATSQSIFEDLARLNTRFQAPPLRLQLGVSTLNSDLLSWLGLNVRAGIELRPPSVAASISVEPSWNANVLADQLRKLPWPEIRQLASYVQDAIMMLLTILALLSSCESTERQLQMLENDERVQAQLEAIREEMRAQYDITASPGEVPQSMKDSVAALEILQDALIQELLRREGTDDQNVNHDAATRRF